MKKERDRDKEFLDSWVPEKNAVTGFTFQGMGMFLFLIGFIALMKYLLF
ncbi:hypothetical protein [Pseudogracilibacillus sp. SO30301A]